jgi:hypothetical protein
MYLNFFSSQETALGFGDSLNEVKHPGSFQGFYLFGLSCSKVQSKRRKDALFMFYNYATESRTSHVIMHNGC